MAKDKNKNVETNFFGVMESMNERDEFERGRKGGKDEDNLIAVVERGKSGRRSPGRIISR